MYKNNSADLHYYKLNSRVKNDTVRRKMMSSHTTACYFNFVPFINY